MSKAEKALEIFENNNCAQSVTLAYAEDFGLENDKALQVSAGFGRGMGRTQEVCGTVSGAIIVMGLASGLKAGDGRGKNSEVYDKIKRFMDEFSALKGTVICRELLARELTPEEKQKYSQESHSRGRCQEYVRLACELLDKYLAEPV